MKLKKETIDELGEIIRDEFKMQLSSKVLNKLAYSLVGYFSLLLKIQSRKEVQK